jgi:hypothetical protein
MSLKNQVKKNCSKGTERAMKNATFNRQKQTDLFGENVTLPAICLDIRATITGASDVYYSTSKMEQIKSFLLDRVLIWTPCADVIDASILAMVHYTIELVHDELVERKKDSTESSKDETKCCDNICPKCFP